MGLSPDLIDFPASPAFRAYLEGRRSRRPTVFGVPITDQNAAAFLRNLKYNLSGLSDSLFNQTASQSAQPVAESNEEK